MSCRKPILCAAALLTFLTFGRAAAAVEFRFTVTADPRGQHGLFASTLQTINNLVGSPGAFHVSPGDVDETIPENRAQLDLYFGPDALWYPGAGNHEQETFEDMAWLRNEYHNGNGLRTPLKYSTNQDGPASSRETTYTWDYENAHFIQLNQYWNGFSDTGADGDTVPALYDWLAADLAANTKPAVFVFGHEPAFPYNRHIGDSLDAHPANRNAFWQLLEDYQVIAFFCGHTHYYSTHQGDVNHNGKVWQVDVGNAGNGWPQTFVDVTVKDTEVTFKTYDNSGGWRLVESWTQPIPEWSTSLTWDKNGPGNWDQQRWLGDVPPYVPDDNTHVEVTTDTVTVAADGSALTLTIAGGGVVIGPGAVLTVGQGVDVAAGAALDVAGTLDAKSLTVAGTSTIAGGAGISIGEGVDVAAGAALDVAGTLDAKSLTVAGTSTIAGGASISIAEGVDVAAGAALDVAGTLDAKSLTVAGTSTIAGGAGISIGQRVDVAAGATLDLAGTLAAGSLTAAGTHLVADGAVLSVADSLTLDSSLDLTRATLTTIPQVTDVHVNHDGVLTLGRALAGRELNVAGRVQAAGAQVAALNVTGGGLLSSSADVIAQDVNVSGGVIHLTDGANLSVAAMQVTGGTVNTGTGHVVVGQRLKIGNHTTIDVANATFQVSSSNLADPLETDNLTLSGGRLTISGGVVVPRGAIASWRLAEGKGLIAADSSTAGNDHFGTINGASWVSDDPEHGTVLSFDGEDDYLEAANTGDIQLGNAYTIAMWIKTSQKGVELLGKGDEDHVWESREKALYIDQTNGQVAFAGMYSGLLSGTTNVADGHWHHVAVTYNALNDQEVYLDGAKDTAIRAYSGRPDSGDFLRLGWAETREDYGYQEYIGLMDDVYVYDRSLSAAEVADLYQAFGSRAEALPNMNLRVTADSSLHLEAADDDLTLGHLALEPGVNLKVTGATVSFQDLTAGHLSSVEGDFSVTGTLSPGDSPGRLDVVGSLEMDGDSTYQWELGVSAADLVAVEGDLKLADGWTLRLGDAGGTCGASAQFDLFTYTGSLTLGRYRLDPQQVEASGRWNWWSDATILHDGSRVYLTGLTVVPEPGTMALAAIAVLGVLAHARRRRCPV